MDEIKFTFPVGYHNFHENAQMNFTLNRWISMGYARFEDIDEVAPKIKDFEDWKRELTGIADRAFSEGRLINAAFYYRAAEFFVLPDDPDKEVLYDRFIDLFYTAFKDDEIERFTVPYKDAFLPAIRVLPSEGEKMGTIVIHGGFDSFIEELYSMARFFADLGYEVIGFEGPGQGAALKKYGLTLNHEWERPTKAILDYFKRDDVTLIGISMGGYLCFRAAAFEPRIKRVVALSIAFDYMQIPNLFIRLLAVVLLRFERLMNYLNGIQMRHSYQERWGVSNLMYITETKTPMEATKILLAFNEENLHSEMVKQDVLILTGEEDHFIPVKMHHKQVKALTNARSVTDYIFTRVDQAQNHCMIGNIGLALDVISKWIEEKS